MRSSRTNKFPADFGGLRRVGWRRLLLFGSGCLPIPMSDNDSWSRVWILPILDKESQKQYKTKQKQKQKKKKKKKKRKKEKIRKEEFSFKKKIKNQKRPSCPYYFGPLLAHYFGHYQSNC
jgi:hypothetical protein